MVPTHQPGAMMLPAMTQIRLAPIVDLARKISGAMRDNPSETLAFNHPALHAVGNNCAGFAGQDRVRGRPNVGCAAIEHKAFSPHAREIAKSYDMFIAISRWNEQFLKDLDIGPVHLRYQGVDGSLFRPAPASGLWSNRFVVFSGGKFEFRKGQDIVTAAFRRFRERHDDALLVTCWQNMLPQDPAPFAAAGNCRGLPELVPQQGLKIAAWLSSEGLPAGSFVDLPYTPNMLMPFVLNECDMAVFPNRCEGGTNLVAMEAMACGIPTYVSNNTGQRDLADLLGCGAFRHQRPVKPSAGMESVEDWGETEADEVLEAMERVYTNRAEERRKALAVAEAMKDYEWGSLNEKLLKTFCP